MVTLQVLNTYKVRKKNTEIQVSRKKVHSSYTYSLKLSYSKITILYLKPKKKKTKKLSQILVLRSSPQIIVDASKIFLISANNLFLNEP